MSYHVDTTVLLRTREGEQNWPGDDVPLRAHVCEECGSVVADTAVHDGFHERLNRTLP